MLNREDSKAVINTEIDKERDEETAVKVKRKRKGGMREREWVTVKQLGIRERKAVGGSGRQEIETDRERYIDRERDMSRVSEINEEGGGGRRRRRRERERGR